MNKPLLLNLVHESPLALAPSASLCTIVHAHEHGGREAAIGEFGPRIEAVVTHGVHGLSAAEMALMPKLSIVACIGAGFENVDLAAARARGIALSYGPHTNASTTADHAVALLLGIVRDLGALDRRLRTGGWKHPSDDPPALSGKRLGLAGVGHIGMGIGRRCEAGFGMEVAYFARRSRPELSWQYMDSLLDLARWCDFLVLALPGDPTVHHIANASVLQALGPQGFLVNIGRGNLVDTAALTTALKERRIAGAALDVFEDEPQVPPELLLLDKVLLTPHLGGRSPQAREAMATLLAQNLEAHFAGRPLPSPVPN
ncbi:MAG: 2-hydroxyacid dehydrogenase [Betaproteobacteria bacterium]